MSDISSSQDYLLCDVCKTHLMAFLNGEKLFREVKLDNDANQFDLGKIRDRLYKQK